MKTRILLPLIILLYGCAQSGNRQINPLEASIEIKNNIINEEFGGVGFHVFDHVHNGPQWIYEQIFAKRWRELNPSFVRINDDPA